MALNRKDISNHQMGCCADAILNLEKVVYQLTKDTTIPFKPGQWIEETKVENLGPLTPKVENTTAAAFESPELLKLIAENKALKEAILENNRLKSELKLSSEESKNSEIPKEESKNSTKK